MGVDKGTAKTVAVIGGGLCGLGAVKTFKEEGFEPVCFERTGNVGGLWRYRDDDIDGVASVMQTTIFNTSKELGAVSNFPPPAEYPNYMHHTHMYSYIMMMAEKFDCLRHVRYYHQTEKIEMADDYQETGRWNVINRNTETGEVTSEIFDCVVVCIGHHVYPNKPTFPKQEQFEGKIMHTHSLKKTDQFHGQRVAVVGIGNSGVDAAVDLSSVTKQVYLSTRRGAWVIPRLGPEGYPWDYIYLRRHFNLVKRYCPYKLFCYFSEWDLNKWLNHSLYNLKPKHRLWSQHPTVSDTLPIKLLSGVVVICPGIKEFTKKGIIFEGEEKETEVDTVIMATGYQIKFPFLSDDVMRVNHNRVHLYKFVFPPHLPHPTLAILGLIQPSGSGIPVGEMQCRWTSRIMAGRHKLPTKEKMLEDIKATEKFNRKIFIDSPRHTLEVNFVEYQDQLAEEIGVKPNFLKLAITDPKLFWALVFGPSLSYQYRLQGPNAWSGARDAILTCKERTVKPLQISKHPLLQNKRKPFLSGQWIFILLPVIYIFYLILFR